MKAVTGHTSGSSLSDYLASTEDLGPERELAARMINQALLDAAGVLQVAISVPGCYPTGPIAEAYKLGLIDRIKQDALDFIFDEYEAESAPTYSFVWLCNVVNMSPARIRSFVTSEGFVEKMQAQKDGQKNRYRSGKCKSMKQMN